jgi:predicted metal-binding membrane protein
VVVAAGYFAVWSALGAAIFPLGAALVVAQMRLPALARAVPVAAGVVVLLAGGMQFTALKARHLAFGRVAAGAVHALPAELGTAWRHGVCLGIHCGYCCAGLTACLLALGVMDLRVMAVVTAAITAERVAPAGARVARAIGVLGIVVGTLLIARAVGSG